MENDPKLRLQPQEIINACEIDPANPNNPDASRLCVINTELSQGLKFISQFEKSVTFLGSARLPDDHVAYLRASKLAKRIVNELNYAIVTGGGPGIMEAGNRGAKDAGGQSIGINIKLPHEQTTNPYVTAEVGFNYFFTRKLVLMFAAEAYVVFPGGFGTMDELFELLTLIQTGKIHKVPVILVNAYFWNPLDEFIRKNLADAWKTISPEDSDLYTITDDEDEIMSIIKNAPIREYVDQ